MKLIDTLNNQSQITFTDIAGDRFFASSVRAFISSTQDIQDYLRAITQCTSD